MSLQREIRRREIQAKRDDASSWRDPPSQEFINYSSRYYKVTPNQFVKNNSHLTTTNSKTKTSVNEVWDQDGNLIFNRSNNQNITNSTSNNRPRRAESVSTKNKEPFVSQIGKIDHKTNYKVLEEDAAAEQSNDKIQTKRFSHKDIKESSMRLSTLKRAAREQSVQPRKKSEDFAGFIERQKESTKNRNKPPPVQEEYKIDISEGSKKIQQKFQKHSVTDIIRRKSDDDSDDITNLNYQPKVNKKRSFRLQNIDYDDEKRIKDAKKKILCMKIEQQAFDDDPGLKTKSKKINTAALQKEHEGSPRNRPNSVYSERKRIQAKAIEMEPILDEDAEEMKKGAEMQAQRKKKKNYMPSYIKQICDVVRKDPDQRQRSGKL